MWPRWFCYVTNVPRSLLLLGDAHHCSWSSLCFSSLLVLILPWFSPVFYTKYFIRVSTVWILEKGFSLLALLYLLSKLTGIILSILDTINSFYLFVGWELISWPYPSIICDYWVMISTLIMSSLIMLRQWELIEYSHLISMNDIVLLTVVVIFFLIAE